NGIRAVARKLKITTRYGGRYLQSVDGIGGSLVAQRDWFYYLDGGEGAVSAADVQPHPGDVLWWDFRRWPSATGDRPAVARRRSATGSARGSRARTRAAGRVRGRGAARGGDLAGRGDLRAAARRRVARAGTTPPAVPRRDADDGAPVRRVDAVRRGRRHARA